MIITFSNERQAWSILPLLRLFAWGVTLAVAAAFIAANVREVWPDPFSFMRTKSFSFSSDVDVNEFTFTISDNHYGWPIFCRDYKTMQRGLISGSITKEIDSTLHPIRLIFDVLVGILIVAATFLFSCFHFGGENRFK